MIKFETINELTLKVLSVISIYPLIFWMLQARFPAMTGLFFTDRH